MIYQTILLSRADGVATITLNRPERRNAMNVEMWHELRHAVNEVEATPEDRVLVITGANGSFCAGGDLGANDTGPAVLSSARLFGEVAVRVHNFPRPTIAKVSGVAIGGGTNLALCCDVVVASEEATFLQGFTKLGLSPDFGGSWLLPRLVGLPMAKQLSFFPQTLSAVEAREIGLVARVVPLHELDAEVARLTDALVSVSPVALTQTKTLLHAGLDTSLEEAVEAEVQALLTNVASDWFKDAVRAFRRRARERAAAASPPPPAQDGGES
jgi:enoyl-CoA hydratase/carnithine racemase